MRSRSARIDQLRLRVPGVSASAARGLAEAVAARLGSALPARSIASLHVRVQSSSTDVGQLADQIAASVRGGRR
jgi:hypothetical protein